MAKLIDADVLNEALRKTEEECENAMTCPSWWSALSVIEKQPTAYDVEKVVEELESLRIDKSNYFGVLNVVAEKYDRANEMLNDAIDIVRKGGVA